MPVVGRRGVDHVTAHYLDIYLAHRVLGDELIYYGHSLRVACTAVEQARNTVVQSLYCPSLDAVAAVEGGVLVQLGCSSGLGVECYNVALRHEQCQGGNGVGIDGESELPLAVACSGVEPFIPAIKPEKKNFLPGFSGLAVYCVQVHVLLAA